MKKLFFMLITLFAMYLGIQFVFNFFSKGNKSDYIITEGNIDFNINEQSYFLDGENNYSYVIQANNNTFNFQVKHNFNKADRVITSIKYFNDDKYECILPIFKNKLILMDVLCYNNGKMNYYYKLKGRNKNLDSFVSSIDEYNVEQFTDNSSNEKIEGIFVYKDNLIDEHYIGMHNYKGIYDISSEFNSVVYNISLYKNDVYNQKISAFVDEYFISADYDKEHQFNKFNVVNMVKLDTYTITSDKAISIDSYIQGVVDGKVYLYDKDSKIQYEINVDKESIISYSGDNIKYYKDGTWTTMSIKDANNELKFSDKVIDIEDNNYVKIDKVGNEVGYYYLYKKNGNAYDVYRRNVNNENAMIYLFTTKTLNSVYYVDEYIYFVNGNLLQVYNDEFGIKNILQFKELEFNNNFKFNVYSK